MNKNNKDNEINTYDIYDPRDVTETAKAIVRMLGQCDYKDVVYIYSAVSLQMDTMRRDLGYA